MSIIQRLILTYKLWQEYIGHFPKKSRHTLGNKIDSLFIDTAELMFTASYLTKDKKLPYLQKTMGIFDLLKFFLQIAWETGSLDNKKYAAISESLGEIGRMLGAWYKQTQTPSK